METTKIGKRGTVVIPAAFLAATMFAFNFIGDGIRDALDPRLRKNI